MRASLWNTLNCAAIIAIGDICLFKYRKTLQLKKLEFFQPGCRNLYVMRRASAVTWCVFLIIMAKRAMDVASRELDREAAVHVQAHCLRSRLGAIRCAAKDCRTVVMTNGFELPVTRGSPSGGRFAFDERICGGILMRSFIATAAVCAVLTGYPAFAQEADKQDGVRIEMDQNAKAFVFIIDDEPVALLDRHGLELVEHLSYGGMLTDKGRESARRDINRKIGEAADE